MKVLIVVAHPDDEIIGCGGTVSRLIREGHECYLLVLGEGVTARDDERNEDKRKEEIEELKNEIKKANTIIGVKQIFTHNFPDNRFDSVSILDIVKVIEKIKDQVKPDMIFTHYEKDLNIDHQLTYKAVITAVRPLSNETVKEIYSFEILSSTEWNFPLRFCPDVFFDITDTLNLKIKAMENYKSELREYPHPRSIEGISINAKYWGMRLGVTYAEAFKCVRNLK